MKHLSGPTQKIVYYFYLTSAVIILLIALITVGFGFSPIVKTADGHYDVSGWVVLVVTTGIGISIALAILIYSNASQKKISDIIIRQNSIFESRKKFAMEQIQYNLSFCKDFVPTRKELEEYDEDAQKKDLEERGMTDFDQIYYANEALNDIRSVINFHAEVLDPKDIHEIMEIVNYSKDLSKKWERVDFRLLNISDGFHSHLDKFFMKYPKVDWSSHQGEF